MRATTTASHEPPRAWRAYALAGAAYSALAVALTFPLVLHLSSVMPHDLGDPLLSTAILWWNAHVPWFTQRWWNGFAFYPAPGFMALSDPRVGESLLATPLQWLGCSPVAAYNLTLLATFPLSALAAHWLAFVVIERHDASALCGLAYGFCPFRIAHLPHLELLAAFGMPAALAALHRYYGTRRRRWLVVFAIALVLQGLCSSYYLLFFAVFLALWLLWFTRSDNIGRLPAIFLAGGVAFAALVPLALGYARIHAYYGFARHLDEIIKFSADATSVLTTSPLLLFWGWTARWARPEGELFPGATIALLAMAGGVLAWRPNGARDRIDRRSIWLLPFAAVCAAIALCGWTYAPWKVSMAGIRVSSDAPFKPLTLALLAIAVWVGASSRLRGAYARRSAFAFYAIATGALFLCAMGPKPALAGHQFLYEPPYAWLMRLGIFESIRVPARFAMPAMLALAMTGALAFDRLGLRPAARRALAAALLVGVAADGWISKLPLPAVPAVWEVSRAKGFAAVLELPLGDPFGDLAATYRAIEHGQPIVNGNSGFAPAHYATLQTALDERDPTAFDGLPLTAPLLVVIDKQEDADRTLDNYLLAQPRAIPAGEDEHWTFFAIAPAPARPAVCRGDLVPIAAAADNRGPVDLAALTDGDPLTWWATPHPQRIGDSLVLDFGGPAHPCAVFLSVGEFRNAYPRELAVDVSGDGVAWKTVATERTAGLTIEAALDDPQHVPIPIRLPATSGRFIRLRLDQAHPTLPWLVTEVAVRGARAAE
jgi:hypothetical protein